MKGNIYFALWHQIEPPDSEKRIKLYTFVLLKKSDVLNTSSSKDRKRETR